MGFEKILRTCRKRIGDKGGDGGTSGEGNAGCVPEREHRGCGGVDDERGRCGGEERRTRCEKSCGGRQGGIQAVD